MKHRLPRLLLYSSFLLCGLMLSAQNIAQDEDTGPYTTCNPDGENITRTSSDLPNAVNVGTIDDRSCYANYKESNIDNTTWGVYNITFNSNNQDTNGLQPRIERSLTRSKKVGVGSYARFTGVVRILETGKTTSTSSDGTYIMQSKGKHTGGGGSPDPAICLYLAKPVYGDDGQGNQVQVSFNLYREQIKFRGGSGSAGRDIVFLTNIPKNQPTTIVLEVGFREDPNDPSKKIHYSDAIIGGEEFNWDIPEPEKGTESGIRYGAYRVKGGRAQIRWANTTYNKVEKDDVTPPPSNTDDFFVLRNLETGQFLTDSGVASTPVIMSESAQGENKLWVIIDNGNLSNIDSKTSGILRATGANFTSGPYSVVSTSKAPPATDSDKVWTVHYNASNDTYRFESGTSGRYLYHDVNDDVVHSVVPESDNRSVWEYVLFSDVLSTPDNVLDKEVKLFPNPTKGDFTIAFPRTGTKNIKIYNAIGKQVYATSTDQSKLFVATNKLQISGVYFVKVNIQGNTFCYKLIVE